MPKAQRHFCYDITFLSRFDGVLFICIFDLLRLGFYPKVRVKMASSRNIHTSAESAEIEDYVSRLSPEEKMLIILKSQLYAGQWQPMIDDLNNRLEGKPYVFKLATRIKDDIQRVHELKIFEDSSSVDLCDYVTLK